MKALLLDTQKLVDSLRWAMAALDHYAQPPRPSHLGSCGPEAGCDGNCQDAAAYAEGREAAKDILRKYHDWR